RPDAGAEDPSGALGRRDLERAGERAGREAVRSRDVGRLEEDGAGLRGRVRRRLRGRPAGSRGETEILEMLPGVEVGRGVDDAVVAHPEQSERMDLEVEVVG